MEKKEITLLVWHDCNMCITKSLINFLDYYHRKHVEGEIKVIYLKDVESEKDLLKTVEKAYGIVSSCLYPSFSDINEELKAILFGKKWYVVSTSCSESNEELPQDWFFGVQDMKFFTRNNLERLQEVVKKYRSRLNS